MEELKLLLPVLGPTAGVIIVVVYFLRHLSNEAKLQREETSDNIRRIEAIEANCREVSQATVAEFRTAVQESRLESREMVIQLLSINRDTVKTVNEVSNRVGELGLRVAELGHAVDRLNIRTDTQPRLELHKPSAQPSKEKQLSKSA
jgi:hypothetical protein